MALRIPLSVVVLSIAMLACKGEPGQPAGEAPDPKGGYPEHVIPCLDAMRELPFAAGENLRGVTESDGECAISISFESQQDIDSFRKRRIAAGNAPDFVSHRLSNDSMQRIPLELHVGGGTVPH